MFVLIFSEVIRNLKRYLEINVNYSNKTTIDGARPFAPRGSIMMEIQREKGLWCVGT